MNFCPGPYHVINLLHLKMRPKSNSTPRDACHVLGQPDHSALPKRYTTPHEARHGTQVPDLTRSMKSPPRHRGERQAMTTMRSDIEPQPSSKPPAQGTGNKEPEKKTHHSPHALMAHITPFKHSNPAPQSSVWSHNFFTCLTW